MTTPVGATSAFRIIRDAMHNAGLLALGQDPNSDQLAAYTYRLNDVINVEQTQGLKLWLQEDMPITLSPGVGGPSNPYSLGPSGNVVMTKPTRIAKIGNYYIDVNNNRRPVDLISKSQYSTLSNVIQGGPVTSIYVDKQQSSLNVYTWYVPDVTAATGLLHVLVQQQVTNIVSITDNMDFPVEWMMFLSWALADEICTGQPQAIMDRCSARSGAYRTLLQDWDVEDTDTTFSPDQRYGRGGSRFR